MHDVTGAFAVPVFFGQFTATEIDAGTAIEREDANFASLR
jgi:hypothetical protein